MGKASAGKSFASRLLTPFERFYPMAKALYMWRMRRAYTQSERDPILILQMGKVGSKSVQAGLKAKVPGRQIYHAHFLAGKERPAPKYSGGNSSAPTGTAT